MSELLTSPLVLAVLNPQEKSLIRVGACAAGVVFLTVLFSYTTRAGVIARATTKEAIRQPLFPLLMALALLSLVANTFLPFFSFGEDFKMLIDCGLATILICGLLLAIWTSSTSIADEIEGKTAMTLLSKPINRRQFVVGKYVGIMTGVFWLVLPLMICFLGLVYYKVGYDYRESANPEPETAFKLAMMLSTIPGLVLIFFEICLLAAVSVAISTRVPMVVNMVTCFAIFVVGHVTSVMVERGVSQIELVQFTAKLLATALPNLELFKTEAAISTSTFAMPVAYLGWSALYCAAFSTTAIFLAFILFEDRDLA
jgi:ABC-type transport system involved in multi-copper enzyme maturation permease subunit